MHIGSCFSIVITCWKYLYHASYFISFWNSIKVNVMWFVLMLFPVGWWEKIGCRIVFCILGEQKVLTVGRYEPSCCPRNRMAVLCFIIYLLNFSWKLIQSVFKWGNWECYRLFFFFLSFDWLSVNYRELDEKMRDAFHSYIEERGVNESLFKFLQAWLYVKEHRNLMRWFKTMGLFVDGKKPVTGA